MTRVHKVEPVPKDQSDHKVELDRQDHRVPVDGKVLRENRALLAHLEPLGCKEIPDYPETLDLLDQLVLVETRVTPE